jgi:hypothetical protein
MGRVDVDIPRFLLECLQQTAYTLYRSRQARIRQPAAGSGWVVTRTAALCALLVDTPGAARIVAGAELLNAMA